MNLWKSSDVPHKGWYVSDMQDYEEDFKTCEMCGKEKIRYVFYMAHDAYPMRRKTQAFRPGI